MNRVVIRRGSFDMDTLKVLEEKIALLVQKIHELKKENALLVEQNEQLLVRVKAAEESLEVDVRQIAKLDEEKALTKMVVDDLIKSIDSLVEHEN
jgi:regulator of replication initiation timing